ncbi:hypothetical protein NQ315_016387 [Exocentrus adspersus]|uniref:A-kinase anchor protein 7-like phosphoesterase domain-containing protein n=1 Tax=Exocentrus adspersus TaxID=1586481 RepID=A0AAV8VPA1_9CUCU|nr:hypothetical protein NQ315_016387 [Exocentrus adspersus]
MSVMMYLLRRMKHSPFAPTQLSLNEIIMRLSSDEKLSPRMQEFKKKLREKTPIDKLEEPLGKHPYEEEEPLKPWPNNTNPHTGGNRRPEGAGTYEVRRLGEKRQSYGFLIVKPKRLVKLFVNFIRALIICGLAAGAAFTAYTVFVKLTGRSFAGGLPRRSREEKPQKSKKMLKSIRSGKPIRMWIDGKCFSIRKFKKKAKGRTVSEDVDIVDIEYENEIDTITDDNGKHSFSFHLPSIYYTKLHRFTDFDVQHLSRKTQTSISWPRYGKPGKFTIQGSDRKSIGYATNEILSVLGAIREQFTAAQFISVPILSPEVQTNFEKFKTEILNGPKITGMHESIFQSPLKLHLTVIVFALSDDREKAEAIAALEEYRNTVLSPLLEKTGPLKLRVEGIDYMQSNYKKTDVLYANVKIINETEEVNFQKIVNDIADYFYERGLVLRHTDNVKLHMTLINTKYRKESDNPSPSRKRWVKRVSFDASSIMEKYKDFVFGESDFDSIHLSLISSKGEDGFYKPLSIIKI